MEHLAGIRAGILSLGLAICFAAACSGGGSSPPDGTGGASAGTGGAGTGGKSATGGAGAGGASTGGTPGSGGAGTGGTIGGTGGGAAGGRNGGGTGGAVGTGGGGASSCAGRAIALSANGTGMDSDAAQAEVVIDLGTALPIGNATRTIEFWAYIKPTDWVGDKNEIYYYGVAGTTTAFGMDFGTSTVTGMAANHATLDPFTDQGFNDDSRNFLGIDSSAAQWVHIAMTWDGTALRTYVNGMVRITTNATTTTMLATRQAPLIIGCNPENLACFNGWFDEFRVWNVARSDQQILNSYNRPVVGNEPGLVGYWKFDDAPGSSTAADSVMGQPAHPGMLRAAASAQTPTFITPSPAPPLICP